ncbi:MAG: rhomboid family intramembrane serine protease [Bacteroidaceae bacterium]|jgi:membrane associated rhomboid family serine protease|nr:rhomboid family intramembrane serine protease [Bacteroidaceae bacterium]MEE0984412.1 rhomboid family intramembrane serine protease [Bacteroidaceae bacterium]
MNMMPPVTKNILIINALCFLGMYVVEMHGINLNSLLGLHFFLADNFMPYQLLTYMFMHGNLEHIFFNMFAVWMFGRIIEQVMGSKRFLFYYLACGIGAGLIQELVQWFNYISLEHTDIARVGAELVKGSYVIQNGMAVDINHWNTVGASGAVYGILLAFGMIFPNERMFIFPIPVPIKAKLFVIGYAVIELLMARSNDGVAHYAHLGGMLVGLIILLIWTDAGHGGPLEKIRNIFRRKPKNNFHVYRKN